MKTKLLRSAALLFVGANVLLAAPLNVTTAVHTKPDTSSPAITYLKAGTEPVAVEGSVANTPAGWMAIELSGPFEGWVENKDLSKNLDVKPGANIRLAPKADSGVLAVAEKGDKTNITGVRGKWTQISLEKKLTGYINVGGAPGSLPPIATTPATGTPNATTPAPAPAALPPAAPSDAVTSAQPAPTASLGDTGSSALPRQFAGRFVSTRKPFTPRRPYDYALNDDAGKRYAYVDISKLLLTEQIEKYIDHNVVVFGAAKPTADGKDIVILVETLQLK